MCYVGSQSVGDIYLLFLLYFVRCHKTENKIYNNEYLQISQIIYMITRIWLDQKRNDAFNVDIDVGSDVAIKMKYTH